MNKSRNSLIALGLALIAACTSTPVAPPVDRDALEAEAALAAARGDLEGAAAIYRRLAAAADGAAANAYLIELAELEVELGRPEAALTTLAGARQPLTDAERALLAAVRGRALFALGRTTEAVRVLVEREIWLMTSAEILDNQALIFGELGRPESLGASALSTGDAIVDGWLALAPLARMSEQDSNFVAGVIEWRDRYPSHPAASGILRELLAAQGGADVPPGKLALLLPLSSGYRAQALAVLEGILAARFASGRPELTDIQIYDTARNGPVESYLTAQIEGADVIVGPLFAAEVGQVMAQAGLVPTLALNIASASGAPLPPVPPPNFYQFALSTDDEIETIAARAIEAGHETAVILHELSADGVRVRDSFAAAFGERGGRILNTAGYDPAAAVTDHRPQIEALLNVAQSRQRHTQLESVLGVQLEFEPRRRADIDMLFLQMSPESQAGSGKGRLLVQQLCLYDTDTLPVYATSAIHNPGTPAAGRGDDLDSVMFPELPILAEPVGLPAAQALNTFSTQSASREVRLFAFGFDAYELAGRLYARSTSRWPLAGATGQVYADATGRLRRMLPFAELENGRPQAADLDLGLGCVD